MSGSIQFQKIVVPSRIQVDTSVAIFLLKRYGKEKFPGIENATVEIWKHVPEGETEETLREKGVVLIDIGGGTFDHHPKEIQTTATELVCTFLDIHSNPALDKVRQFTQRSDFFGKGIISTDPLDRAFGYPGLLVNLNKMYNYEPNPVMAAASILLEAHLREEEQRTLELPQEFEEKKKKGDVDEFTVKHYGKNLRCVYITTDNVSMAGYLRSQIGGRYDVVAIELSSGHINILTRPTKRVNLERLAAVLRRSELMKKGDSVLLPYKTLAQTGAIAKVPEWYYDPATNSLQNGGVNPESIAKTRLTRKEVIQLIKLGLEDDSSHTEHKAGPTVIYSAAFLSDEERKRLLSLFPAEYENVYMDHMTITFKPTKEEVQNLRIGEEIDLPIIGIAKDEKAQALIVDTRLSSNENPHITVSTAQGVEAKYSNELIKNTGYMKLQEPVIAKATIGLYTSDKRKLFSV